MSTLSKIVSALLAATAFNISSLQAAEVELVDSFNINMGHYGMSWYSESFTVAVDNLSAEKEVFIHREKADGSWVDIPMSYAGSAGEGKEYWKVTDNKDDHGAKFAVGMKIDGATYWDNNNGKNYKMLGAGYLLGDGKDVVVHNYYESAENVRVNIVVDNIAPSKEVKLIYTTDNWQTSNEINAHYDGSTVMFGYGTYPNPNANNAESWTVVAPISGDESGEFYVAYTVNGQTYYNSNYGDNYKF